MMLSLERRSRLPHWSAIAAIGALLIWGGIVLLDHRTAASHSDQPLIGCHVRALTGVPCATCGGTRAAAAMLKGDLPQALRFNPLVTLAAALATIVIVTRIIAGRQVVLTLSRSGWWWISGALITAVAANWWYVARGVTLM